MSIVRNVKMIEVHDWDQLVSDTYNRPYSFSSVRNNILRIMKIEIDGRDITIQKNLNVQSN